MAGFKVGDTVRITGATMTGNVGTVISIDDRREKYLVMVTPQTQNYFTATELELFRPGRGRRAARARGGRRDDVIDTSITSWWCSW